MRNWQNIFDRRNFLKMTSIGGTALFLTQTKLSHAASTNNTITNNFLNEHGPIDRTLGDHAEQNYYGDMNERPHKILWNIDNYLKNKKVEGVVEEVPLVIIGGGLSGLFTAYSQKKHNPIVLEQAPRFGGNAKGQSWRGMDYALGSAYIDKPYPNSPMEYYFKELNLNDILVERTVSDPVEFKGKIYKNFWEGEVDLKNKESYLKIQNFFQSLAQEKERSFPLIPSLNDKQLSSIMYFDKFTLHELLSSLVNGKIPTALETAIEYYCWSTYAASSKEISAASALNFLAQEENSIYVGAGGNAKIAERLLSRLTQDNPISNFRPSSIVVKVRVNEHSVDVFYEDNEQKLRQIRAKTCVMSCPKFVVARILEGIEPERLNSIRSMTYRSYMTANLLVKKNMQRNAYDLFMTGNGTVNFDNIKNAHAEMNATDFVLCNFADASKDFNILTFYNALPYDGARAEFMTPNSFQEQKKNFEKQITQKIMPLMNFSQKDIVDLRLALWGHALPLAKKGFYSENHVVNLRKPFKNRVFFIEQDNWAYPSLQTGATESQLLKQTIENVILSKDANV